MQHTTTSDPVLRETLPYPEEFLTQKVPTYSLLPHVGTFARNQFDHRQEFLPEAVADAFRKYPDAKFIWLKFPSQQPFLTCQGIDALKFAYRETSPLGKGGFLGASDWVFGGSPNAKNQITIEGGQRHKELAEPVKANFRRRAVGEQLSQVFTDSFLGMYLGRVDAPKLIFEEAQVRQLAFRMICKMAAPKFRVRDEDPVEFSHELEKTSAGLFGQVGKTEAQIARYMERNKNMIERRDYFHGLFRRIVKEQYGVDDPAQLNGLDLRNLERTGILDDLLRSPNYRIKEGPNAGLLDLETIQDELIILIEAGSDTVKSVILNAFMLLEQYPNYVAELENDPTGELLDELIHRAAFVIPPVQMAPRQLAKDTPFARAGTIVMVDIANTIHNHPDAKKINWSTLTDREGWIPDSVRTLPWGALDRFCSGYVLSVEEAKLVIRYAFKNNRRRVSTFIPRGRKIIERRSTTYFGGTIRVAV